MYSSLAYGHQVYGTLPFGVGILAATLLVCLIILKGYSLWAAAKRDEKWWFIALLIINTMGLLEIIYIVFFVKKYHKNLKSGHQAGGQHHSNEHHSGEHHPQA